jgi:cell division inhibitor SulA
MNTAIKHDLAIQKPSYRRMTEVIIPQGQHYQGIIFPLVASFSQQDSARWVTWFTDCKPSREQLAQFGADITHLRIIHTTHFDDYRWILWDALNTGNSHTIIAEMPTINSHDIEQFELAAGNGHCIGIIVRHAG